MATEKDLMGTIRSLVETSEERSSRLRAAISSESGIISPDPNIKFSANARTKYDVSSRRGMSKASRGWKLIRRKRKYLTKDLTSSGCLYVTKRLRRIDASRKNTWTTA